MKKFITLGGIILAVLLLAGCGTPSQPAAPAPAPAENPSAGNTVEIKGFAFGPATLTISKGTTVTWTNRDSAPHTITSDTNAFSSPSLSNGQAFSFTFNEAGEFGYHCGVHPSMKGKIIVQ